MTTTAHHATPDLAELRRLAEAATPGPWEAFGAVDGRRGERWLGVTTDMRAIESARAGDVFAAQNCTRQDALFIAAANPAVMLALLDAAAERDRLAECVRAYGRTIDRWGLLIIAATHSEDITTPDGDGDWEVIESRLAEVPALLAERDALAAKVEAVRALHRPYSPFRGNALFCGECEGDEFVPYPCPTARALDGGAES